MKSKKLCFIIIVILLYGLNSWIVGQELGRIGLGTWIYRHDHFDDVKVYRAEGELVGYWSFDNGTGNSVYENSGNGNDGTIHGATWTTGISGSALEFDGMDDYVEMKDPISLANTGFTVEFFICLSSKSEFGVLQVTDGSNGWGIWVGVNDFVFEYWPRPDDWPNGRLGGGQKTPSVGVWKHIVMVYNDHLHQFLMYGDTILEQKWDIDLVMSNSTQPLEMGSPFQIPGFSLDFLHGLIDEVRIYNRALNVEEILTHYELIAAPSHSQTPSLEGLNEIAFIVLVGLAFVVVVGYVIWRQKQLKKRYPKPYAPLPVTANKTTLRKEIPRIEPRVTEEVKPQKPVELKNYFIEIASSMGIRESFTIQDENNNVILKGSNLIPKGLERFSMIGFVGGVFLPIILFFIFIPLFAIFLFIPWAIGYTIVFNILINRFRRTYKFQDANGLPFGELKGNMSVSNWKIIDPEGVNCETLQFPRMGKEEFFTLDTPDGRYTTYYKYKKHLGGAIRLIHPEMFKEIEVTDSSGVLAFTLLNYGQMVQSEEVLSSLITLLSGICVVIRFAQLRRQREASMVP